MPVSRKLNLVIIIKIMGKAHAVLYLLKNAQSLKTLTLSSNRANQKLYLQFHLIKVHEKSLMVSEPSTPLSRAGGQDQTKVKQ